MLSTEICGSFAMASSLMVDDWLSILMKCSGQHSSIFSLSKINVFSSALSREDDPGEVGP